MLRVLHAGVYMYGGGAERWLGALAPLLADTPARITKSVVVGRRHFDRAFARTLPFPVSVVSERGLAREARDADVFMWWGPVPVDRCLARLSSAERPRAVVFVAHHPQARGSLALGGDSVDHVICVANHLRSMVAPAISSSTLYPITDPKQLVAREGRERMRRALGFSPNDFVTGFIGSLTRNKRPDALVTALAELPLDCKALIVGSGELRASLTRKKSDRVKFAYALDSVGDYYSALDAVCLPSREEGFSLVAMEALHWRLPLLITPHGDVPLFFRHRENAWILDDSRLVDSIREGISAVRGELRASIAEAGYRLGERFTRREHHAREFADTLLAVWKRKIV